MWEWEFKEQFRIQFEFKMYDHLISKNVWIFFQKITLFDRWFFFCCVPQSFSAVVYNIDAQRKHAEAEFANLTDHWRRPTRSDRGSCRDRSTSVGSNSSEGIGSLGGFQMGGRRLETIAIVHHDWTTFIVIIIHCLNWVFF